MAVRTRKSITNTDLDEIDGLTPLARADAILGVRVYDVGQGDSIAILDQDKRPVVQVDYGGREGHPFVGPDWADAVVPVAKADLVMMTHWDEDHWCAARKATTIKTAKWLVPRQITSPRAVQFSTEISSIRCIPETHVGRAFHFTSRGGDELWWEKIAHGPEIGAEDEDCNRTGVALSVVRRRLDGSGSVILLPGDAPFDRIGHYWRHFDAGLTLRGVVAFHHGAGTHWTRATEQLLTDWADVAVPPTIIFSCARPNSYNHPDDKRYSALLPRAALEYTADKRGHAAPFIDLLF